MADIILDHIKELVLGSTEEDSFDTKLISDINTSLMELNDIGVGVQDFRITKDGNEKWSDLLLGFESQSAAITFIELTVRLLFDPPQTTSHLDSVERQLARVTWRLNSNANYPVEEVPDEEPIV